MERSISDSNKIGLTRDSSKKKADINFKKWLLSLSSVGNFVLGALLIIMGVQ
jgi:hypothetical protein